MTRATACKLVVFALAVYSIPSSPAQKATSEFEVASIKPSLPDGKHGVWTDGAPTRIRMLGMNVKELLTFAYDVEGYRVVAQGVETTPYDIYAKGPDAMAKLPDNKRWEQFHLMTQALLASRFRVSLHHENREMQVYSLAPAKGGTRIKELGPTQHENVMNDRGAGHLSAQRMPMSQLVSILRGDLRHPVLDETGVAGVFDVSLDWAPENSTGPADPRPSLAGALEEKLGLKLTAVKRPIDVFVVDHAEKPSEN